MSALCQYAVSANAISVLKLPKSRITLALMPGATSSGASIPSNNKATGCHLYSSAEFLMSRRQIAIALSLGLFVFGAAPSLAHPHVWVTMHSDLLYAPDGTIAGIRQHWTFDDMFSAFAVQGLESKEKGKFTREELQPLAKVNVESLKEYDYFTYATVDGKKVPLSDPLPDYWLDQ